MSELLTTQEVLKELRISKSTLSRLRERGEFVARVQNGGRTHVWRAADVRAWMAAR